MWERAIRWAVAVNSTLQLKRWIPAPILHRVRQLIMLRAVSHAPDRRYLEDEILPCLSLGTYKKILFVGCEPYTRRYGEHFANSAAEYWTTDIQPDHAAWGEPRRHVVCDVREIDCGFPGRAFDVVLLNGVFGFGVNDAWGMDQTLERLHRILKPNGILLIGWNTDLVTDPRQLPACRRLFTPGADLPLPESKTFQNSTHRFQFLTARDSSPPPSASSESRASEAISAAPDSRLRERASPT